MKTELRPVQQVKPGDTVQTWMGPRRINAIEPYTGPHDFVIGVARFDSGEGMTMEENARWEVDV